MELNRINPSLPLSIVIPIWNTSMVARPGTEAYDLLTLTKMCVGSIVQGTTGDYEIIIVDNGSEQPTKTWLKEEASKTLGEKLTYITNPTNLGVAKGWNQGIRASRGRYIAIVNNDTLISPRWNENLLPMFERHKERRLGTVSPAEVTGYPWKWPDISKTEEARMVISRSEMFKNWEIYWPNLVKSYTTRYSLDETWDWGFHGSWFVTDRAMWEDVGLMDENFVGGFYEDHDIGWRMRDKNWHHVVCHNTLYYHFCEQSMNAQQRTGCIEKNRAYLTSKWGKRTF